MRKTHKRLTEEEWLDVKTMVCSGENAATVARSFGIAESTVGARKRKEGWRVEESPKRELVALARTPEDTLPHKAIAPDPLKRELVALTRPEDRETLPHKATPEDLENQPLANLLEIAQTSPERFQEAVGAYLEGLMAQGIADIPPPRTISELAKLNSMIRQTRGLDSKTATGGLFDPVRPLRRATVTLVDAEPDPLDGFEV
jgi:hypothetical protein